LGEQSNIYQELRLITEELQKYRQYFTQNIFEYQSFSRLAYK